MIMDMGLVCGKGKERGTTHKMEIWYQDDGVMSSKLIFENNNTSALICLFIYYVSGNN